MEKWKKNKPYFMKRVKWTTVCSSVEVRKRSRAQLEWFVNVQLFSLSLFGESLSHEILYSFANVTQSNRKCILSFSSLNWKIDNILARSIGLLQCQKWKPATPLHVVSSTQILFLHAFTRVGYPIHIRICLAVQNHNLLNVNVHLFDLIKDHF